MTHDKKPSAKDVARWLAGEISDAKEIESLLIAMARDPNLRAAFEILDNEPESSDLANDDPLAGIIRSRTAALRDSVAWGITLDRNRPQWLRGETLTGMVFGRPRRSDQPAREFRFELRAAEAANQEYLLTFDNLPTGVTPLNLTVADIGLRAASPLAVFEQEFTPSWGELKEDWERRRGEMARPWKAIAALAASGAAFSGHLKGAADVSARQLRVELRKRTPRVDIACKPDPDRAFQIAVMETRFPEDRVGASSGVAVKRGLLLERHPTADTAKDFIKEGVPLVDCLPDVPYIETVWVTVRGAKAEDLWLLSSDDVKNVLGQCEMNPFPLTKTDKGYCLRVLDSDREDFLNPQLSWLLTVSFADQSTSKE